jgi:hypothetical protein
LRRPPHDPERVLPDALDQTVSLERGCGGSQRRVLAQYLFVERPQLGRGIDPELVGQEGAGAVEGRQRVRLPARPVQRDHQLAPQPLAQWMLGGQALEFADEVALVSRVEIGGDAVLDGGQPQLGEPRDLGLQRRGVGEIGERWSLPQVERLPQHCAGGRRVGRPQPATLGHEAREAQGVDLVGVDRQPVALAIADDTVCAERLAQVRHVALQRAPGRPRRVVVPDLGDQLVGRDRVVRADEQVREHEPLLRPTQ